MKNFRKFMKTLEEKIKAKMHELREIVLNTKYQR